MLDERKRTVLLGLAFLVFLAMAYFANTIFFGTLGLFYKNHVLLFLMILVHNIIVVSLILLGMAFYVNLVVFGFFKREKHAFVILENPRKFAVIFAFIIVFLSILQATNFLLGSVIVEALPVIFLASAPIAMIEGYGVFLTIEKTLDRTMTMKGLVQVYGIFVIAAVVEVSFVNILR